MFLKPKALLRVKGEELIPGEPADEKQLKEMIDAPIGDRSQWKPRWPKLEDYTVEIGKAKTVRPGTHATVVSYGRTLPLCLQAANELAAEGMDIEVIDMRSLWPYDWAAMSASIRRTRRVLFVNEDTEVTNFGEHLYRRTVEEFFYELDAAPQLLAGKHLPGIGLADNLEMNSVPQLDHIREALKKLLSERA